MAADDTSAVAPAGAAPKLRRSTLHRAGLSLGALLVSLVLLAALALSALWWAVRSEPGTAWLLSYLPGVKVTGLKGPLLGDFETERVVVELPGGSDSITLTGLGWRGLRIERGLAEHWVRIVIADLHAARVDVKLAPSASSEPLVAPTDLRLPIEVELQSLRIGALYANAIGELPLRDLRARVHIGAKAGDEHFIDQLSLAWDRLKAEGEVHIGSRAPLDLTARLALSQDTAADNLPAWNASATLAGPLAAPRLQATLRAQPAADRPAQTLDARATLRPFAAWPLGDLQATARALDLAAFSSAAPATALDLDASATSSGLDQPASVSLKLHNAEPGRWNEGRLPLRSIELGLAGRPDQPSTLELTNFSAELGNRQKSAGRLSGAGRWNGATWNLDALLAGIDPAQLDARAAAMQLGGPVTLVGSGFDAGSSPSVDMKAELTGLLTDPAIVGTARAVKVKFDSRLEPLRIELREARAVAGAAQATLQGVLTREAASAPWHVKGQTALIDFDPTPWWPGGDNSPWRQGPHRVNASGEFDLVLPATVAEQSTTQMLAAIRGQAGLTITKSVLAGVPVSGQASLRSTDGRAAAANLLLDLDGNTARVDASLATTGPGAGDTWKVTVDAPTLARLGPLWRLFQPAGTDAGLAGALSASASLSGRWPNLTSTGQLEATALRAGPASAQSAQARWTLGTQADAPIDLQATLTQVTLPATAPPPPAASAPVANRAAATRAPALDTLQLSLKGTGRAHQLDLRADANALPPAWTDALIGTAGASASASAASAPASAASAASTPGGKTSARLTAQGGLFDLPKSPLAGWRGSLQQLDVRSSQRGAAALLEAQNVGFEVQWSGGPAAVSVQPGRAVVLGAGLRWSRIGWQAATADGTPARIDAQAELEPIAVAPLLARLQPDFGWAGDLMVRGRLNLRSAPSFAADIVLERSRGDLTVTDEASKQSLGLTELRLALNAANGVWTFTPALAGAALGSITGSVSARTTPQALWPAADAPLQGSLEVRINNLGTWGTWVPPGWRLDGALRGAATIAGRFGAPEYTGTVEGSKLGVRNFLQGVNISDGDVKIALQGDTARIERFSAKAGAGTIRMEGDASLGEAPKANLKLTATAFQLLGRVDRRIVTSGQAQLRLDRDTLTLDGQFNVDEGQIDFTRSDAPALSDDVVVMRGQQVGAPAAVEAAASAAASTPPPSPTARKVALDLRVTLGQKLRVRGRGLDTGLRGELHITSPDSRMAVNGTVSTADGTYDAYGQKLSIDRGLITFTGSTDNPRLDIEATRPNTDVRVGVRVSGTTQNPRIRLFSEPELSEIDKLSWLVMGRASDGLGRTDTALLQRAALALLAGEGPGKTDQLIKSIGLDELSVSQSDGEVRDTVISLGKQISRRWYVGYERGLNATSGNFQLIYKIAQRFTLRAQSGLDNSVDVIWTWRWN